jgi:alcohol dehydrogenase (cytochrome c)
VLYIVTGADDVFAMDVETGERVWTYQANLDQTIDTICCGWSSRGVSLGDGKIFVGQLDGKLVALDQKTGRRLWSTQAERWQDGFTITSAPLYYDGLVIAGFSGAEFAIRGRVKAFDADDGSARPVAHRDRRALFAGEDLRADQDRCLRGAGRGLWSRTHGGLAKR